MPSFYAARMRLTAWYIIISALISIVFSIAIYDVVTRELRQSFIQAEQRLRGGPIVRERAQMFLQEEYIIAKNAVIVRLIILNTVIIASSGFAGYFLASKVLEPIEDMVEEQKRFIGDASHELRTPLTALRSEIEVSLRDKSFSSKAKNLLRSNLEEVQNMQNLVFSLLALSRYTDRADVAVERVNLASIAAEVIKQHGDQAKKRKVKIEQKLEEVQVDANAASIRQLFSTLIDNAIKYNKEGGTVTVQTKKKRRHAYIKIADTGMGIPSEDIPHIFNRFYRVDASRSKNNVEGYGLGLSIAHSIVELHSGEIWVSSKLSSGTSFHIHLPY